MLFSSPKTVGSFRRNVYGPEFRPETRRAVALAKANPNRLQRRNRAILSHRNLVDDESSVTNNDLLPFLLTNHVNCIRSSLSSLAKNINLR